MNCYVSNSTEMPRRFECINCNWLGSGGQISWSLNARLWGPNKPGSYSRRSSDTGWRFIHSAEAPYCRQPPKDEGHDPIISSTQTCIYTLNSIHLFLSLFNPSLAIPKPQPSSPQILYSSTTTITPSHNIITTMHFLTLPLLLLTASLSTALVLQPRQNADGAQDGCHVTDYISQCPSSGTADTVSAKCDGWCWPAVAGGPSAVGTWDPLYCGVSHSFFSPLLLRSSLAREGQWLL